LSFIREVIVNSHNSRVDRSKPHESVNGGHQLRVSIVVFLNIL